MASHFVAVGRNVEGTKYSDFTTGTSASAVVMEFRLDDAAGVRPADVIKALDSFKRFFENAQQWSAAGFVING